MKENKLIESWWVELLPNGIYHLLINTKDKWMPFHAYNDTLFEIGDDDENEQLEIPKFLPKLENAHFLMTKLQEKDQISFYWIPFQHEWIKNGYNIIHESKP